MNLDQKEKPSAAVDESSPKPSLPEEPTSASPPPPRRKSVGVMITLPPDSAEESPISPISKTSIFPRTHSRTNTFGTVVPTDESSNTTANKIPSNLKATD
ncbi:hypothetical protein M413DRAFT_440355 [Hebeloma cylindrosporum]|uniref:Uncharacterized protein n=1 Tax=Hebeloma cylindrosporum TaxID=76867 RepID=A0A0C2YAB9_HEBCY|nr:hypothetical protein M413DRAFT_440355 [Hebeloma cylindrosporum h7]